MRYIFSSAVRSVFRKVQWQGEKLCMHNSFKFEIRVLHFMNNSSSSA